MGSVPHTRDVVDADDDLPAKRVFDMLGQKADYVFEGRLRKAVTKAGQTIDTLLYARVLEAHP